jgi:hypothetical protein
MGHLNMLDDGCVHTLASATGKTEDLPIPESASINAPKQQPLLTKIIVSHSLTA